MKHSITIVSVLLLFFLSCATKRKIDEASVVKTSWPVSSYNYGGLEKKLPQEQMQLLENSGYDGMVLKCEKIEDFNAIDEFIRLDEAKPNFKINAVFERYNFDDDDQRKERWRKVADKIAQKNIQLWIIFGKKTAGITDAIVEQKLREIVSYCKTKKIEVILYPHSDCYFSFAEEALPLVEKINEPNLNLAVHLYHEIRAGNGARMDEVFQNVKHRLGAVTLAGSDVVADYTNKKTRDTSTIKPIGRGTFDLGNFIKPLQKSNYKGTVVIMNFGIKENPETYLPRSLKEWQKLTIQNK